MNAIIKSFSLFDYEETKLIPHDNPNSRYNRDRVLRNYENFKGTFELLLDLGGGNEDVELGTDVGITNSFITAVECLGASLYAPSVLFASISVEVILNHDIRLDNYRITGTRNQNWISLGTEGLKKADEQKIPVRLLCDSTDCFPDDIKFVKRRNKIAHGDVVGFRGTQKSSFSPRSFTSKSHTILSYQPTKDHAEYQINKARNFIESWAEAQPKIRLV